MGGVGEDEDRCYRHGFAMLAVRVRALFLRIFFDLNLLQKRSRHRDPFAACHTPSDFFIPCVEHHTVIIPDPSFLNQYIY